MIFILSKSVMYVFTVKMRVADSPLKSQFTRSNAVKDNWERVFEKMTFNKCAIRSISRRMEQIKLQSDLIAAFHLHLHWRSM